jgi:hypothetical protein
MASGASRGSAPLGTVPPATWEWERGAEPNGTSVAGRPPGLAPFGGLAVDWGALQVDMGGSGDGARPLEAARELNRQEGVTVLLTYTARRIPSREGA